MNSFGDNGQNGSKNHRYPPSTPANQGPALHLPDDMSNNAHTAHYPGPPGGHNFSDEVEGCH